MQANVIAVTARSDSIRMSLEAAYTERKGSKLSGFAIAVGLHAIVIVLLLQLQPVRSALTNAAPIVVRLISPRVEPKPEVLPKPLPVKPRAQRVKPVDTPPVMTAITEQPTPFVAPPPPPVPVPVPPPEVVIASQPAPPAPPAPVPVTPPSFNADYLNNPPPAYPALSRRTGEEGKVVLRVFVNEQGLPAQVQLRTSSGHARLDDAALNTVRQWKFVPARRGEIPVGAWVLVPITFILRS